MYKRQVLPSGFTSKIAGIHSFTGEVDEAHAPMSVTITLEDELDISRGCMIVKPNNKPEVTHDIELMICWFSERDKLQLNKRYTLRHTTQEVKCLVKEVRYKVNVNTTHKIEDDLDIALNEIGRIVVRTSNPLFVDAYKDNRQTGSVVLVDEMTNTTVAAGMII